MKPQISVIIPVYNTSLYLKRCLDSLMNQTFKEFEVIIINDGSTDDSENISLGFVESDKRFSYYKQKNKGKRSKKTKKDGMRKRKKDKENRGKRTID